jgi:hypothetical protein
MKVIILSSRLSTVSSLNFNFNREFIPNRFLNVFMFPTLLVDYVHDIQIIILIFF